MLCLFGPFRGRGLPWGPVDGQLVWNMPYGFSWMRTCRLWPCLSMLALTKGSGNLRFVSSLKPKMNSQRLMVAESDVDSKDLEDGEI